MVLGALWGTKERGISETQTNIWNKSWILLLGAEGHSTLTRQVSACSVQYPNRPILPSALQEAGLAVPARNHFLRAGREQTPALAPPRGEQHLAVLP